MGQGCNSLFFLGTLPVRSFLHLRRDSYLFRPTFFPVRQGEAYTPRLMSRFRVGATFMAPEYHGFDKSNPTIFEDDLFPMLNLNDPVAVHGLLLA
jgi:hypothetical protein